MERDEKLTKVAGMLSAKAITAREVAKALAPGLGHNTAEATRLLGSLVRMGKAKSLPPLGTLARSWVRA
jgi:hypothetical protein